MVTLKEDNNRYPCFMCTAMFDRTANLATHLVEIHGVKLK